MISLQSEILGSDQLSSVPLTVKTPEHFTGLLQAGCLDVDRPLLAHFVHGDVEDGGVRTLPNNLLLDAGHPVVASNGRLVLDVKHVPHLQAGGGRSQWGRHVFVGREGAALPSRAQAVGRRHVRPRVAGAAGGRHARGGRGGGRGG